MTAKLTPQREIPNSIDMPCIGCKFISSTTTCSVVNEETYCTTSARDQGLKDPATYYWYDPLVHITSRLKA